MKLMFRNEWSFHEIERMLGRHIWPMFMHIAYRAIAINSKIDASKKDQEQPQAIIL